MPAGYLPACRKISGRCPPPPDVARRAPPPKRGRSPPPISHESRLPSPGSPALRSRRRAPGDGMSWRRPPRSALRSDHERPAGTPGAELLFLWVQSYQSRHGAAKTHRIKLVYTHFMKVIQGSGQRPGYVNEDPPESRPAVFLLTGMPRTRQAFGLRSAEPCLMPRRLPAPWKVDPPR